MTLNNQGTLIVFSGLPASGKTTLASRLAKHLQATYIRMDAIVLGLKSETYSPDLTEKCYRVARSLAMVNLRLGGSVITDSINSDNFVRKEWNNLAQITGAKLIHIEIICSNKEEHKNRLKNRTTTLAGLIEPTWLEIEEIEYQAWDQQRVVIDTAGKTEEIAFEEILSALKDYQLY